MQSQKEVWEEGHVQTGGAWEALPMESRVWVHCSNRMLTLRECDELAVAMSDFLASWSAHGQALQAGWRLEGRRCLIIGLNEAHAGATGCSIDKLVHLLQAHTGSDASFPLNWMRRDRVIHYYIESHADLVDLRDSEVRSEGNWREDPLADFWAMRKAGKIDENSLIINPVIRIKGESEPTLAKEFRATWHAEMWR